MNQIINQIQFQVATMQRGGYPRRINDATIPAGTSFLLQLSVVGPNEPNHHSQNLSLAQPSIWPISRCLSNC